MALGFESLPKRWRAFHRPPSRADPQTGWNGAAISSTRKCPLAWNCTSLLNGKVERLPAPGTEEFWTRRVTRETAGLRLPGLSAPDSFGLRLTARAEAHSATRAAARFHMYEVARLLESRADDGEFWPHVAGLAFAELRRLEAVVFGWRPTGSGARRGDRAGRDRPAPAGTQAWFEEFATSPAGTVSTRARMSCGCT